VIKKSTELQGFRHHLNLTLVILFEPDLGQFTRSSEPLMRARVIIGRRPSRIATMLTTQLPTLRRMSDLYIQTYSEAVDRHYARDLPPDLRTWAELLSRHHASLRPPWVRDRPACEVDDDPEETSPVAYRTPFDVVDRPHAP